MLTFASGPTLMTDQMCSGIVIMKFASKGVRPLPPPAEDFYLSNMKTKFNNLMLSKFHLYEIDNLPSKKYKAIISSLLHYFYDDEEPDFSKFDYSDQLVKIFNKMVKYIEEGLRRFEKNAV